MGRVTSSHLSLVFSRFFTLLHWNRLFCSCKNCYSSNKKIADTEPAKPVQFSQHPDTDLLYCMRLVFYSPLDRSAMGHLKCSQQVLPLTACVESEVCSTGRLEKELTFSLNTPLRSVLDNHHSHPSHGEIRSHLQFDTSDWRCSCIFEQIHSVQHSRML